MGPWKKTLAHVAWAGVLASGFPGEVLPAAAQQAATLEQHEDSLVKSNHPFLAKAGEQPISELPDSPGAVMLKSTSAQQHDANGTSASTSQPAPMQSAQTQASPQPQKPVGTAAAEAPDTSGVAASQPAGVAMAPAKQHRVRTIVLRMGAIMGAGAAVGTVIALTSATSSKPPGAH
jgi:hypothetical protein